MIVLPAKTDRAGRTLCAIQCTTLIVFLELAEKGYFLVNSKLQLGIYTHIALKIYLLPRAAKKAGVCLQTLACTAFSGRPSVQLLEAIATVHWPHIIQTKWFPARPQVPPAPF